MQKRVRPVSDRRGKCPSCRGHGSGFSYVCKTCGDTKKCPRCKGEGVVHN